MANQSTSKTPKKKPGWIRACFGLRSSSAETQPVAGGHRRRRLGSGILRALQKPWRNKDKTTSSSTSEIMPVKAVPLPVPGTQKSLLVFLGDQTQGPLDAPKDSPPPTTTTTTATACRSHSGSIKESNGSQQPVPNRVLPIQSRSPATKRSSRDPLVGMSILIAILVIMLTCGRICAILCTSVWLYCMPQLARTSNTRNGHGQSQGKRVVWMGFLHRKHNIFC